MSVHRIRLVGPWDYQWHGPQGPEATSGSVKMPCEWRTLFGDVAGSATFSRRFHRPTNLEAHERVVIVLTGVGGTGRISLNGAVATEFSSGGTEVEVDVTERLLAFNTLEVQIEFDPSSRQSGGLYDLVVLEIRG